MEKIIRRIESTNEKLWEKNNCPARKWMLADMAALAALTICTQTFSGWMNVEYGNDYNRMNIGFHSSVMQSYGTGSAKGWMKLENSKALEIKKMLADTGTTAVWNELSDTTETSGKQTETVVPPVVEVNEQKQESQILTDTAAGTESVKPAANAESTAAAVPDTSVKEDAAVIGNEDVAEEVERTVEPAELFDLDGFRINEAGMIESCADPELVVNDGIIILPSDERCTGIGTEALNSVSGAEEIYIPANVTTIEPGALEKLSGLMYIEVAPENPVYESIDGALYNKSGELLLNPQGR